MSEIGEFVTLNAFYSSDEAPVFQNGQFDIGRSRGATLGRATYEIAHAARISILGL